MQLITDLHIHSRFSRAVSKEMTIEGIARWAMKKGIGLMATGDWTHPMWMREIEKELEEDGSGLLTLKTKDSEEKLESFVPPRFLLSTEISCIYSQNGKTRRVHTLVWVPTIASAMKISQELTKRGCNILSDGRPIIGLSVRDLAELVFTAEKSALIVPAHIWTPWFSIYGKMGGFESIEEAFGPFAKQIYAVETGLSSSPDMNWRINELDMRSIVSFSDAHSGPKLGREATIFQLEKIDYEHIRKALMKPFLEKEGKKQKTDYIDYTIEFYPEEGKYHYTGHRDCNVRLTPEETVKKGTVCSVCGKPLTQGVMQRVEELAGRTSNELRVTSYELDLCRMIKTEKQPNRPPFVMLVPLQEIIAEALGCPVTSKKMPPLYDTLTTAFGGEFNVLLHADLKKITNITIPQIADGIRKVRSGDIVIDPGYDGVFGVVKIWKSEKEKALVDKSKEQLGLF